MKKVILFLVMFLFPSISIAEFMESTDSTDVAAKTYSGRISEAVGEYGPLLNMPCSIKISHSKSQATVTLKIGDLTFADEMVLERKQLSGLEPAFLDYRLIIKEDGIEKDQYEMKWNSKWPNRDGKWLSRTIDYVNKKDPFYAGKLSKFKCEIQSGE